MNTRNTILTVYSTIVGIAYLVYGIGEIFYSIGLNSLDIFIFPFWADPIAGFSLIVVSMIFFTAAKHLSSDHKKAYMYIFVGILLASLLALTHVSVMIANWAECCLLFNEDYTEWTWFSDLNPAIPLFALTLPLIQPLREIKWKKV